MSEIIRQTVECVSGRELADLEIAKQMTVVLDRHYPGHMWAVNVDSAGGVATVKNFRLSGQWGFVLKLGRFILRFLPLSLVFPLSASYQKRKQ